MLLPPKLVAGLFSLLAGACTLVGGCSSSQPRDMNYGTDAGLGYTPPDYATTTTTSGSDAADASVADSADADGGADADSGQASVDVGGVD